MMMGMAIDKGANYVHLAWTGASVAYLLRELQRKKPAEQRLPAERRTEPAEN